jgi:hypothetical protein
MRSSPSKNYKSNHSKSVKNPDDNTDKFYQVGCVADTKTGKCKCSLLGNCNSWCHPLEVHPTEEARHVSFSACDVAKPGKIVMLKKSEISFVSLTSRHCKGSNVFSYASKRLINNNIYHILLYH